MSERIYGACGALLAAILNIPPIVGALVLLILLDILTGWAKAFITREVNSEASLRGMTKKALMLSVVALAWIMDHYLGTGFPVDLAVTVAGFYCVTEVISILENVRDCGVPVPTVLVERFHKKDEEKK